VSDQDFFFDEDEAPAAKAASAVASDPAVSTDAVPFTEQSVTVVIAGLLMVISLLVGAIIGFLMGGSASPVVSGVPAASAPAGATGTEPGPLTNEQIQGGMPSGHPAVGATDAAGTTAP
jgi:hypothetical protein